MDEFVVYILFSEKHGKTYVGFTLILLKDLNLIIFFQKKVLQQNIDLGQ